MSLTAALAAGLIQVSMPACEPFELTLYFGMNSSALNPYGEGMVEEFARRAKASPNAKILLVGHSDTAPAAGAAMSLSKRRAAIVADRLEFAGVERSRIMTQGRGETDLARPTKDGVAEQHNRRVVMSILC